MPVVFSESWLTRLVVFGNNLHTCHNLLFCQPYFPPPLALSSYVQQPLGKHPFPKTESLVWWHSRRYTDRNVSTQFWQQLPPSPLLSLQITAFLWLVFHLIFKFCSFACFFHLVFTFSPLFFSGKKKCRWEKACEFSHTTFCSVRCNRKVPPDYSIILQNLHCTCKNIVIDLKMLKCININHRSKYRGR